MALGLVAATACSGAIDADEPEVLGSVNQALVTNWSSNFSDAAGWTDPKYYSTIRFVDVSGDGRADVCGRGNGGINCGASNGSSFPGVSVWQSSFSDAAGWGAVQYYSTIRFPQINGSGGKDVCGRGISGINCATSTGTTFGAVSVWQSDFSDVAGWNQEKYYYTLDFPDVTGDGKSDVCGRGIAGIICATSNGASFGATSNWSTGYSDGGGWTTPEYYKTIKFPDLNGDGKADVCGRGAGGLKCAISTGSTFGVATLWASVYSDANSWNLVQYYSTLQFGDLNGDGKADVCGRSSLGMQCALSNGTSFNAPSIWTTDFNDATGFNAVQYYSTLRLVDINADGKADVCGRGIAGELCALSNGASFGVLTNVSSMPNDAAGWNAAKHYATLGFANVDSTGDPALELCGRGVAGILCDN